MSKAQHPDDPYVHVYRTQPIPPVTGMVLGREGTGYSLGFKLRDNQTHEPEIIIAAEQGDQIRVADGAYPAASWMTSSHGGLVHLSLDDAEEAIQHLTEMVAEGRRLAGLIAGQARLS